MKKAITVSTLVFATLMFMQSHGAYIVTASRDYVDKQVAAAKTNVLASVEIATNEMWATISDKADRDIPFSKIVYDPPQLSTNDVWLMSADYLEPGDEIVLRYGSRGSFGDNSDCDRWVGDDNLRTALAFDHDDSKWIVTNVDSVVQQSGDFVSTNLVFSLIETNSVVLTFNRYTESITNGTYSVVYKDELDDIIASFEPKNYEAVSSAALSAIQSVSVNGEDLTPDANKAVNVEVPVKATTVPEPAGTAEIGDSAKYAAENHVHPAETSFTASEPYALPLSAFPITYTYSGTSYSLDTMNDVEIYYDEDESVVILKDKVNNRKIAMFHSDDGTFYFPYSTQVIPLKFNDVLPVADTSPVLELNATNVVRVRGVKVANEEDVAAKLALKANDADVLKNSGDQTLNGNLQLTGGSSNHILTIVNDDSPRQSYTEITGGSIRVGNDDEGPYTVTIPFTSGTLALVSQIYAAVQQIAPAFTTNTTYAVGALCTNDGILYQCTNAVLAESSTAWDGTYWEAKNISELFVTQDIDWATLKSKKDRGLLVPGAEYRITNYVCTTTQPNTMATNHQFDIIVTADSTIRLNENARAVAHIGDNYFSDTKFESWKLNYCLDNDISRFEWADNSSGNGRGVIYRMIDEFGNDLPYDFKNILFQRWAITGVSSATLTPEALASYTNQFVYASNSGKCYAYKNSNISVNGTVMTVDSSTSEYYYTFDSGIIDESHILGDYKDASIMGYKNKTTDNKVEKCLSTSAGITRQALNNIVFLGIKCYSNTFGYGCLSNTFGYDCSSNTFGNYCYSNTFGDECYSNTFGYSFRSNTFGNRCYSNTFGYYCHSNAFGNYCYYNTFGDYCYSNTFGDQCYSNTFGKYCDTNTFGNYCHSNTFGDYCYSNAFGNGCYSNTFGDGCLSNTFGNYCYYIKFGSSSTIRSFYRFITIESGNWYIYLDATGAAISAYYQNVEIKSGMNNTEDTYKTITDSNVNQTWHTTYQSKNSKVVEIE